MSFPAAIVAALSVALAPIAHHREHQPPRTKHHHHIHHAHRHHTHHRPSVYVYARQRVLHHWRSIYQWDAFRRIVGRESGWDPCAYYPSSHDCGYTGWSACGIPQRDPCPGAWRGRLYVVRYRQVDWMIRYIEERYGTPAVAYAHETSGSY